MTEENTSKIVTYPCRVAASNPSLLMLQGERIHHFSRSEADYFAEMMKVVIDNIALHILEEILPAHNMLAAKDLLARAFIYCFDKSVEVAYILRVGIDQPTEFNVDDLYNGMGGDQIPEYIQLKITPLIGKIASIFLDTFGFVNNEFTDQGDLKDLMKSILFGGMFLGTEYFLRLDLKDASEYNRLMFE